MTEEELREIDALLARQEANIANTPYAPDDEEFCDLSAALADHVPALLAEARRLRAAGAELIEELHDAAAPHLYGRETAELAAELAAWRARFGLPAQ